MKKKLKKIIEKYEEPINSGEWVDANFAMLLFELKELIKE